MSAKPKLNPDKLLRDYARKRRDDAASLRPMPDSVRDELHAQVVRTHSRHSNTALLLHWICEFWPRIAFGGAVCIFAVLGVILWQFQYAGSFKQSTFALNDTSKPPTIDLADKNGVRPRGRGGQAESIDAGDAPFQADAVNRSRMIRGMSETLVPDESSPRGEALRVSSTNSDETVAMTVAESLTKKTEAPLLRAQPMQEDAVPDNDLGIAEFKETKSPVSPEPARFASPMPNAIPAPLASSAIKSPQIETANSESTSSANQGIAPAVASAQNKTITLHYTQVDRNARLRRNFNSPPYPDVLRDFEVRIRGANLSVIDSDGSIYEGTIRGGDTSASHSPSGPLPAGGAEVSPITDNRDSPESVELLNRPPASATASGSELEFYFRAVGSNRSLSGQVVFSGNMRDGRLEGEVSIGGTNQFKIEAIPVLK